MCIEEDICTSNDSYVVLSPAQKPLLEPRRGKAHPKYRGLDRLVNLCLNSGGKDNFEIAYSLNGFS